MAYPYAAPAADFGTLAARERIAGAISPRYSGGLHFAGLIAQAALIMGAALWFVEGVRWWQWLLVPGALVFANGFEWLIHRGPLHHPWPPRLPYNRHTLTHHAAFSAETMAVRSRRELRIVLFPLFALPLLHVIVLPVVVLLALSLGRNVAALFVFSTTLYYLLYELLHLAHHLPPAHPVARLPLFVRLRRHHQVHHDPRCMTAGNFNVSFPLFDWVLGTRLPEAPQRAAGEGAHSSAAAAASGDTQAIS